MRWRLILSTLLVPLLASCSNEPDNPSFPVSRFQAHMAIMSMADNPRPLPRPLVIIGGYEDPFFLQTLAKEYFQALTKNPKIITVSLIHCANVEEWRTHIMAEVNAACGNTDPNWTAEVDVVGISLGGLAARVAAAPSQNPAHVQRLRIARLFTVSSPLTGARLASLAFTNFQSEMKPNSELYKYLATADPKPTYEIYSYVHLDDEMVGPENAALPGHIPYWLPNPPLLHAMGHEQIMVDERMLAEIARRLRGETPFTLPTPTPLPKS